MDYSLAKRLKEAGFPQEGTGNWWVDKSGFTIPPIKDTEPHLSWLGQGPLRQPTEYDIYNPTLSELIEACPTYSEEDGNFSLTCMGWKKEGPKWLCGYEKYETYSPECAGRTPEEAVANLWLSLKNSPL